MVDKGHDPRGEMAGWAQVKLISRGYFMFAVYDSRKRMFMAAGGGTYAIRNGVYKEYILFHTVDPSIIGRSYSFQVKISGDKFYQRGNIRSNNMNMQFDEEYSRIDYGRETPLVGAWRKQEVQQAYINSREKKTIMMLLTGRRFQRVTINSSSKEVISVVGGTYSYSNGQWSERHEFNKGSSNSVNRRFSFESRHQGGKLGIMTRSGYRPDVYVRLD